MAILYRYRAHPCKHYSHFHVKGLFHKELVVAWAKKET
jgi:hypothetical protein